MLKVIPYDGEATLEDINALITQLREGERLVVSGLPDSMYRQSIGFSTSELKTAEISPAHWKAQKEKGYVSKAYFNFGTCVHWAILEPERIDNELVIKPEFELRSNEGKENYLHWLLSKCGREVENAFKLWVITNSVPVPKTEKTTRDVTEIVLPKIADQLKKLFELFPDHKKIKMPKRTNDDKLKFVAHILGLETNEDLTPYKEWIKAETKEVIKHVTDTKEITVVVPPKLNDQYKKLEEIFPHTFVTTDEWAAIKTIEKNLGKLSEVDLSQLTHKEVSGWYRINGKIVKGRADALDLNAGIVYDLKTTKSINQKGFTYDADKLGYNFSAHNYMLIFECHTFKWVAVEKTEPYQLGLFQAFNNQPWIEGCLDRLLDTMAKLEWAIENDKFAGPYSTFVTIEPYRYQKNQEEVLTANDHVDFAQFGE